MSVVDAHDLRRLLVSWRFALVLSFVAGAAGLLLSVYVSNPYTKVIPAALVVGAVVGFLVREEEFATWQTVPAPEFLLSVYFLVGSLTTVLYAFGAYRRTLPIHLLTIALFVLTALLVLTLKSARGQMAVVILTAVYHRLLIYYGSAVQIGLDALFHNRSVRLIAEVGSLEPLTMSKYWYAPLYHLLAASGVRLFGVSARDAAFVLVTITSTMLLTLFIYLFLERLWGPTVGALGALLFVAGDQVVFTTIHTTPTTLGLVIFTGLVVFTELYLESKAARYFGLFVLFLVGMVFTHQLTMFITVVILTAYIGVSMLWKRDLSFGRGGTALLGLLYSSFILQAALTKYGGPASSSGRFLTVVAEGIIQSAATAFEAGGQRAQAGLPPEANVVVSGADALSISQVAGVGVLFALGIVGASYWLSQHEESVARVATTVGGVVAVTSGLVFGMPIFGISTLIPSRWFPFLYFFLAVLAAPGVIACLALADSHSNRRLAPVLLCLLVLTTPYAVFMLGNGTGAADNPLLDDAPGASRLSVTSQEAMTYEFATRNGGRARILADFTAGQQLRRNYGRDASMYSTRYGESGTTYNEQLLIVYRGYASTNHVSYTLVHQNTGFRVYGPLPGPLPTDSVVFTTGEDRLVYRSA